METVHFTQRAFRTLLDCFARPGTVGELEREYVVNGLYAETVTVCMSLLDGEVSFQTATEYQDINQSIRALTGGQIKPLEQADFIIIPHGTEKEQLLKAVEAAKVGDLIDPQKSATIMIELDGITPAIMAQLSGPGIKKLEMVELAVYKEFIELRTNKNKEFPLGIDCILIERSGRVIALPRTTSMNEVTN
ncbi:phosphonate C-P lyase system protein PhnH [Metasolibacillus meyeri]|uniref:Phosphonate C-P lyase system protein PhnH n=1 Tax=Metasolibacillus meyeri TaxID=1071052 RepID=A0AAW9NPY1_9BACL|nr:phosphonate C-P lyase system protein PhnH [Metasolibacillus meyeri]MEC1177913.1 phosphonate C-P lyase system protein PhnH [Metasolibacillus meyeri]